MGTMKSDMKLAEQTTLAVFLSLNPNFSFLPLNFEWFWYLLFIFLGQKKKTTRTHLSPENSL